jgi:DNA-binding transcriptional LysR family regulator
VFAVSLQLQFALVATGGYLTMLPVSLMRHSAKRLSLKALALELTLPSIPTGLVTLKNRAVGPAAQLFIQICP